MESLKQTIAELSQQFNTRMDDFQSQLPFKSASTLTSTSDLAAQFISFKEFILKALSTLQQQVDMLAREMDRQEMRNRRKFLLVHGVPECKNEDNIAAVTKVITENLGSDFTFSSECISRCHRMGSATNKSRPLIVKFKDVATRDKVWFSKTALKGTGITMSEFLTKVRHSTFLAARQKFGLSKCWTKSGNIVVIGPDGKRFIVQTLSDLNRIQPIPTDDVPIAQPSNINIKASEDKISRTKRPKK